MVPRKVSLARAGTPLQPLPRTSAALGVEVLRRVAEVFGRTLQLEPFPWSADYYLQTGVTIPPDGYAMLRDQFDAVFSPVLTPLGAILTPVLAPRLAAFFPLVAGFAFVAQIDAQTVVLIAHAHALEIRLAAEVSGELRELLALLRR